MKPILCMSLVTVALATLSGSALAAKILAHVDPDSGETYLTVPDGGIASQRQGKSTSDSEPTIFVLPTQQLDLSQGSGEVDMGETSYIDLDELVEGAGANIIQAILQNKREIERENAEFIEQQKAMRDQDKPLGGDTLANQKQSDDLDRIRQNLDNLIGNVVKNSVEKGALDKDEIDKIISDVNDAIAGKNKPAVDETTPGELTDKEAEKQQQIERLKQIEAKKKELEKAKRDSLGEQNQALKKKLEQQKAQQAAEREKKQKQAKQAKQDAEKKFSDVLNKQAAEKTEKAQQARQKEREEANKPRIAAMRAKAAAEKAEKARIEERLAALANKNTSSNAKAPTTPPPDNFDPRSPSTLGSFSKVLQDTLVNNVSLVAALESSLNRNRNALLNEGKRPLKTDPDGAATQPGEQVLEQQRLALLAAVQEVAVIPSEPDPWAAFIFRAANDVTTTLPAMSIHNEPVGSYNGLVSGTMGDTQISGSVNMQIHFNAFEMDGTMVLDGGLGQFNLLGGINSQTGILGGTISGNALGGVVDNGSFSGQFFGPQAQEVGGTWGVEVIDSSLGEAATGIFAAKQ
jgi:septal ring factor EnvC (AmiA/AmiB activator)